MLKTKARKVVAKITHAIEDESKAALRAVKHATQSASQKVSEAADGAAAAVKRNPSDGQNLHDLLLTKLSVLYDVEQQLLKALPKMESAATDKDLAEGFKLHLKETENHVARLDEVFGLLGAKPDKSMTSAGIRGIIEDANWVIKHVKPAKTLDANLIAAASYAEHYEMAGYMAAKEWASEMEYNEVAELLNSTLKEEITADQKLAVLGVQKINQHADWE